MTRATHTGAAAGHQGVADQESPPLGTIHPLYFSAVAIWTALRVDRDTEAGDLGYRIGLVRGLVEREAKKLFLHQWSTPERIDRLTGWLATFQDPLRRDGHVRLPFGALAQEKSLPAVADRPLHYRAREITSTNPKSPDLRIAMFPSCIIDHFLPNAGYAAARVLQALGAEVHVVEGRRCCGLPQLNGGDRSTAEATGVHCVIADNPGCLTHLRGALDARRNETRVRHLAEVLWESPSNST